MTTVWLSVNDWGEIITVEEVSVLDDIIELSRPMLWQKNTSSIGGSTEMRSSWEQQVNCAVSLLTCVQPRDGDGCRSYQRLFILQCYDITAVNSNKFNIQAPPSAVASPIVKIVPLQSVDHSEGGSKWE